MSSTAGSRSIRAYIAGVGLLVAGGALPLFVDALAVAGEPHASVRKAIGFGLLFAGASLAGLANLVSLARSTE